MQLERDQQSTYIIEVRFGGEFSTQKSNDTTITLWGRTPIGRSLIYRCPHCGEMIPHRMLGGPTHRVVCVGCYKPSLGDQLVEGKYYKLPVQRFVRPLAKLVRSLEFDTDIILIRPKSALSLIIADEMARGGTVAGVQALEDAREDEKAIYTMKALKKDLETGAELEERLKAFLLA